MPDPVVPAPVVPTAETTPPLPPTPTENVAPQPAGEAGKPPETTPAPVAAQNSEETLRSTRFAMEAKRESTQRRQELLLKKREEAILKREESITHAEHLQKLAKENPLEFLRASGTTAERLTEQLMTANKPRTVADEINDAKSEAQRVRQEFNQFKTDQERSVQLAQEAKRKATMREFVGETVEYLGESKENQERWELINKKGDEGKLAVASLVVSHYKKFGTFLDVDKAADHVEAKYEKELETLLSTKKASKKTGTPAQTPPVEPPRTLSNSVTPAPGSRVNTGLPQSDEERVEAAVKGLKDFFAARDV